MDAEYKLADAFAVVPAYVCGPVRAVHIYRHVHKRMHIYAAICVRECVSVRPRKRSRPHISAALLCIQSFPLPGKR